MVDLAIRDEAHYLLTVKDIQAHCERIEFVGDAKALADKARAAQVWAERARLGDEQVNLAAVAKLWAERRAGELLAVMRANGERVAGGPGSSKAELHGATLDDLGVSKAESSRWQKLAEIPPKDFALAVEEAAENGAVTATKVRRLAVPLSDELLEREQRRANIAHLNGCLRGFEVTPGHARAEMKRLLTGEEEHSFDSSRFDRAAAAARAYADVLREAGL